MKRFWQIVKVLAIIINVIIALGLMATSFSGGFDAAKYPKIAVFGMTFPIFLAAEVCFLIFWLIWRKFIIFIIFLLPAIICWDAIYTYAPLNPRESEQASGRERNNG